MFVERRDRCHKRRVEEPGYRREITAGRPERFFRIIFKPAIGPPPDNAVNINFIERLLIAAGAAAVGDRLIERR